jgi:DNA-binding NarL/FixJ family response regulator
MTRVAIADDQALIREGLSTMLGLVEGIEVVGVAADGEAAVGLAQRAHPDVVLMDLRMPRCDGVEATRRIRALDPSIQVIVLTTYADDESIVSAIRAGARGYLTKDSGVDEIRRAIAAVMQGQALLDPAVQARLLERIAAASAAESPLPDGLTPREAEVLQLIAGGLSNREISKRLFVSEATVKTHINNLFSKTGVRDRAQAVVYAHRHGLAEI